jgi:hypothetical protein
MRRPITLPTPTPQELAAALRRAEEQWCSSGNAPTWRKRQPSTRGSWRSGAGRGGS